MLFRSLIAALALAAAATDSQAGPFRRHAQPAYQPTYQPAYRSPTFPPTAVTPSGVIVTGTTPAVTSSAERMSGYAPAVTPAVTAAGVPGTGPAPAGGSDGDGLGEVNAKRAARGLRPFVRDEGLTQAARACA